MTTLAAQQILAALSEDLQTTWVPDVAGGGDAEALAAEPMLEADDIAIIDVPKPNGTRRATHQLSVRALARLRQVCEQIGPDADQLLAPTVCGYRLGAEPGSSYSDEFRRYSELARGFSADATHVLALDVRDFFATIDPGLLVDVLMRVTSEQAAYELGLLLTRLNELGVRGLAAGYADMRMLANVLLAEIDATIEHPFVRWVDDYRVFLSSPDDAAMVVERLDKALSVVGLALNPAKTRLWQAEDAAQSLFARNFESVYHPGEEPPAVVRAALRNVFLDAVARDEVKRRELRFALPRMAEVQDDFAVEFCCSAFNTMPWEAPRFVQYLTALAPRRPDLAGWTAATVCEALANGDDWLTVRMMPLAARLPLDRDTLDVVAARAAAIRSRAVWGHLVRLLAIHGCTAHVRRLVADPADVRASVVSLLDLGEAVPGRLRIGIGAITARASNDAPFPPPSAESLL